MTCELLAPFVTFRPYELALHRRGGAPLDPPQIRSASGG